MDRAVADDATDREFRPIWIGELELSSPDLPERVALADGTPFQRGRILVRTGGTPLGFLDVDLADGAPDREAVVQQARSEFGSAAAAANRIGPSVVDEGPMFSVVLCTHNRPAGVSAALGSFQGLRYPNFEVIVVDNAPGDGLTADVVARLGATDVRIRYVCEPTKGLSRARNRGLAEARGKFVAFTDDDVRVDRLWLDGLLAGFERGGNIACVTGLVVSSSLEHPAEQYFDKRIWWSWRFEEHVYARERGPLDSPLHPYAAGIFGAGANFAARADVLRALGGFDQCLGAGSPTQGGEDLDMFVRILLSGHGLSYEPAALVWHDNRVDYAALHRQMYTYGLGLTAYLTKFLLSRSSRGPMLRRALGGLRHTVVLMRRSSAASDVAALDRGTMAGAELRGMLAGPLVYLRTRRAESREHVHAVAPPP